MVDNCFKRQAAEQEVNIHYANITQGELIAVFKAGAIPIILISTFLLDRKKAPHWVVMIGFDDDCLYMHDPDRDDGRQSEIDCQFIPIAREDFDRMSCFGKNRLRKAGLSGLGDKAEKIDSYDFTLFYQLDLKQ